MAWLCWIEQLPSKSGTRILLSLTKGDSPNVYQGFLDVHVCLPLASFCPKNRHQYRKITAIAESNNPVGGSSARRLQSRIVLAAPDKQFGMGIVLFSNFASPSCRFCQARDCAALSAALLPQWTEKTHQGLDFDARRTSPT
jgi:hypothetical protein